MQNSEIDTYISMNSIQNKHKYNTSITIVLMVQKVQNNKIEKLTKRGLKSKAKLRQCSSFPK